MWMNKKFVYQVGNNKKVILWCTANQISRFIKYGLFISHTTTSFFVIYSSWQPVSAYVFRPSLSHKKCMSRGSYTSHKIKYVEL